MSLIKPSSASPEDLTVCKYSRCSAVSSVSSANSVIPSTPFMGVRISWLMLARNSLLAPVGRFGSLLCSLQLRVCAPEFLGPGCHFVFQVFAMMLQLLVTNLNLSKHLVKAGYQNSEFIMTADWRANSIVLIGRNDVCDLC